MHDDRTGILYPMPHVRVPSLPYLTLASVLVDLVYTHAMKKQFNQLNDRRGGGGMSRPRVLGMDYIHPIATIKKYPLAFILVPSSRHTLHPGTASLQPRNGMIFLPLARHAAYLLTYYLYNSTN